jgi:P27 family predicted phage terminase small subunit
MPAPKPDSLKVLSGTFREDRQRHKNTPASGMPVCPKELSDEAKKEWKQVARLLVEAELLSRLDLAALSAYATAWALWQKAEHELRDDELLLQAGNSLQYANPLIAIAGKAHASMLSWARELGLTPAARQKLPVTPPRTASKLAKYLHNEKDARRKLLFGQDEERKRELKFFGDVG